MGATGDRRRDARMRTRPTATAPGVLLGRPLPLSPLLSPKIHVSTDVSPGRAIRLVKPHLRQLPINLRFRPCRSRLILVETPSCNTPCASTEAPRDVQAKAGAMLSMAHYPPATCQTATRPAVCQVSSWSLMAPSPIPQRQRRLGTPSTLRRSEARRLVLYQIVPHFPRCYRRSVVIFNIHGPLASRRCARPVST